MKAMIFPCPVLVVLSVLDLMTAQGWGLVLFLVRDIFEGVYIDDRPISGHTKVQLKFYQPKFLTIEAAGRTGTKYPQT